MRVSKERVEFRFSEEVMQGIRRIQEERGIGTMTGAVEYAVANYFDAENIKARIDALAIKVDAVKKYMNECRRNDYLMLSLLDVMALKLNITDVNEWRDKKSRSVAMDKAQESLSNYLNDIATRNRAVSKGADVLDVEDD